MHHGTTDPIGQLGLGHGFVFASQPDRTADRHLAVHPC
jgi:hypothetical protein